MKANAETFERNVKKILQKTLQSASECSNGDKMDIIQFAKKNGQESVLMASFIEDCGLSEQFEQYRNALAIELLS